MTRRTYVCARCGRKADADQFVYSKHTGKRYCVELEACKYRAALQQKQAVAS